MKENEKICWDKKKIYAKENIRKKISGKRGIDKWKVFLLSGFDFGYFSPSFSLFNNLFFISPFSIFHIKAKGTRRRGDGEKEKKETEDQEEWEE